MTYSKKNKKKNTGKSEKHQKLLYGVKPKYFTQFNISKKSFVVLLIFPHRYQLVFATYVRQEFPT